MTFVQENNLLSLEERDVENGPVEVDELEQKHLERETVFIFREGSRHFWKERRERKIPVISTPNTQPFCEANNRIEMINKQKVYQGWSGKWQLFGKSAKRQRIFTFAKWNIFV